jgi:hypothetical protein
MIVSPIQDFPYNFLLNSAAEPDRQQLIRSDPDIQAFRLLLVSQNWVCFFKFLFLILTLSAERGTLNDNKLALFFRRLKA